MELASVVATSVIIDTLHRALAVEAPALPVAVAGEPSQLREADLVDEGAWVPISRRSDASATATGLPADPNIRRAMSMVAGAPILFFRALSSDHRIGIPWGAQLNALVEEILNGDAARLRACCKASEVEMGADAVRDTLVVASAFNGITRVADATSIPLDEPAVAATASLRAEVGIDRFDYAAKNDRYA